MKFTVSAGQLTIILIWSISKETIKIAEQNVAEKHYGAQIDTQTHMEVVHWTFEPRRAISCDRYGPL